jgi:hypothetical protein
MQPRKIISGLSDLKQLLIRTYSIERSRALVKLHFTEKNNELLMHDYDDHNKVLILIRKIDDRQIRAGLTANAHGVVKESLNYPSPSEFLNTSFKLNGFFKS